MSIATEITRLQNAKADIKTAIESRGVTVPSSAKLDVYDDYILQLGGSLIAYDSTNSFSTDANNITVNIPANVTRISILVSLTRPGAYAVFGSISGSIITQSSEPELLYQLSGSSTSQWIRAYRIKATLTGASGSITISRNSSYGGNSFTCWVLANTD